MITPDIEKLTQQVTMEHNRKGARFKIVKVVYRGDSMYRLYKRVRPFGIRCGISWWVYVKSNRYIPWLEDEIKILNTPNTKEVIKYI